MGSLKVTSLIAVCALTCCAPLEETLGLRASGTLVTRIALSGQCGGWFELDRDGRRVRVHHDGCISDAAIDCPGVRVFVEGYPTAPGEMEATSVRVRIPSYRERRYVCR